MRLSVVAEIMHRAARLFAKWVALNAITQVYGHQPLTERLIRAVDSRR
jgi:hypothetical protein